MAVDGRSGPWRAAWLNSGDELRALPGFRSQKALPRRPRAHRWQRVHGLDSYTVARPPWWGRRIVPGGAAVVLLAAVITGYVTWGDRHCGGGWWPPAAGSTLVWTLDGHAALSYDAVQIVKAAVEHLRIGNQPIPITPGDVWREISAIRSNPSTESNPHPNNNIVNGVTGPVDYGSINSTGHNPVNKQVSILLVQQGEVNSLTFSCGAPNDPRQGQGCPLDQS
jgi:hypothetical protein